MIRRPFGLAVKAVILDDQGRALLLRRSPDSRHFAGTWEWPGGKCDPGEPFDEAVVREVNEECGLDVVVTGLAGATEFEVDSVQVVMLCMHAEATGGELALSAEHDRYAWVPFAGLTGYDLTENARSLMLDHATYGRRIH